MTAAGPKFSAATRDRDKINASLLGTLYAAVTPRLERCLRIECPRAFRSGKLLVSVMPGELMAEMAAKKQLIRRRPRSFVHEGSSHGRRFPKGGLH